VTKSHTHGLLDLMNEAWLTIYSNVFTLLMYDIICSLPVNILRVICMHCTTLLLYVLFVNQEHCT